MWTTNAKIAGISLAVIGFYTLVAHIIPQLQSEIPAQVAIGPSASPEELAAAGERIYSTVCTACHGLGTRAPNLVTDHEGLGPMGARCQARLDDACKEYLYRSLVAPGDSVVAGFADIMPDMRTQLDANQLWAVIAYLQAQGGEITVTSQDLEAATRAAGQPAATAAASNTTDPRELLREKGCLGCHPIDGVGSPIGPPFDGIGSRLNREQIREGILNPNATVARGYEQFAGTMPPNFGDQLTAAQLEAMVNFLAGRR